MKKNDLKKMLDSRDYIKICDALDLIGLYKIKGFYQKCKAFLKHRNYILRMYALATLVEVSCRDETKVLIKFTKDKNSSVKVSAYTLLFYLTKKDIYLKGVQSVLDSDDDYHLLYVTLSYSGVYNQKKETQKLINLIKNYPMRIAGGFKAYFQELIKNINEV